MSLASKIAALAASLVIAATLTLFFLVQDAVERTVVSREQETLGRATTLAARELTGEIERGIADVRVAAQTPSVAGLVQSLVAGDDRFPSQAAMVQWETSIERYFRALMAANPSYLQVRLIGLADGGREIVRLNRTPQGIARVPEAELQPKGDRPYFRQTLAGPPGSVHVTPIEPNQERGMIEEPQRPVVRVATVVTTDEGRVFGIIVINIDMSAVFKTITSASIDPLHLYVANAAGDYIVAPDPAKTLGFDRGGRHRIQEDFPWLYTGAESDARLGQPRSTRSGDILARTVAVEAGEGREKATWTILGTLDIKKASADFLQFRSLLIGAALLLIALGTFAAVYFAHRLTAPLRQLSGALRNVGEGSFAVDLPAAGTDTELSDVRIAFETMRDAVQCREEGLRDAQARNEAIVDGTVSPIITIDERGKILHVNRATFVLFGYAPGELEGQNVSVLMPSPDREAHDGYLKNYLKTGDAKIIGKGREVLALRKDGSTFPVDLGVAEVKLGAGRTFVGTLTDLTEMKKLEKMKLEKIEGALKLEKMKGEFVATVSHELRTPLTSIKGSLALLASERFGALPGKARSMIEIASANSERLARLINDILDLEKIKAGQMTFVMQELEVPGILQEAARANASYAEQFGVGIKVMPVAQDLTIEADPDRVEQALANLISNAVKYSPRGAAVTLSARRRHGVVRINVADKGPGIPKAFQDQVFERFAQADSSDARRKGGTGLGLCITKAIAEAHGGAIGYRTVEGKGTTFFIDMPAGAPAVDAGAGKPRILVCEDDPDIALLLRLIVEDAGYGAEVCQTAGEARRALDGDGLSAMALDLSLPDADGLALLREVRRNPKHATLPVIVVSGATVDGEKRLDGGVFSFVDWLEAPIDPEQLRASIARLIDDLGGSPLRLLHVGAAGDTRAPVAEAAGNAIITQAGSIKEAVGLLQSQQFDAVILDLALPDGPGEQLLPLLNRTATKSAPAVLLYATNEQSARPVACVHAGPAKQRTDTMLLKLQIERLVRANRGRASPVRTLAS